jgi:hypothetical protein
MIAQAKSGRGTKQHAKDVFTRVNSICNYAACIVPAMNAVFAGRQRVDALAPLICFGASKN